MVVMVAVRMLPSASASAANNTVTTTTDTKKCIDGCHAQGHCCGGVPPAGGEIDSECQQPSCAMGCLMGSISKTFSHCTASCQAHSPQQNCSFTVGQYTFNTCESCPSSCGGVQPDCGGSDSVDGCLLGCRL